MRPARRLFRSALLVVSLSPAALALSGGCESGSPPTDARALNPPQDEEEIREHGNGLGAAEHGGFMQSAKDPWKYAPPANAAWSMISPMSIPRGLHRAAPITMGRVLVAGGSNEFGPTPSAEAYEPALNAWVPIPPMAKAREHHSMTVLDNGDVLVAGGFSGMLESSAEIFSVDTDTWVSIPPMDKARSRHTATLLDNGRVLLVGGMGNAGVIANSQIFDPFNGYWPNPSFPSTARMGHTATLLGNGTVLVVGGQNSSPLSSAEIFHPDTNSWSATSPLSTPRVGHTATLLFDGRVLVTGGFDSNGALDTGEIYEPGTEKWSAVAPMIEKRANHAAVALSSGKVLVMGGSMGPKVSSTAEMYDPETNEWRPGGMLGVARESHTATRLGNGKVVIAGGKAEMATLASVEMFEALPLASPCKSPSDCLSGYCADGVCCNEACEAGPCDACSETAGSAQDGVCTILDGSPCDDKDACTKVDTCEKDVCVGKSAVECNNPPPCKVNVCEPASGQCKLQDLPDGEPCSDGDQCSLMDSCSGGMCIGTAKKCEAFDICHEPGACDMNNGMCSNPDKPNCELPEERPPKPTFDATATFCDKGEQCPSGFCVDGVCCDSACNKICHSCVVPGSEGKCTPAPAGTDPRRQCGFEGSCGLTCPGTGEEKCVDAFAGSECSPNQCFFDGIHGATAATCSGKGDMECSSADRIPFNCSPYRCVGTFGACSTSCSRLHDCAEPYVCSPEGKCVSAPAISSGYASSCAFAPAAERPRNSVFAFLLGALLLARRRPRNRKQYE
ncbi:MAG: hypothetical protein HUU21_00995 [Polyangiaceae bacterium]|nr:hypothetical protein [Polyangiaceae bacterium]